MYIWIIQVFAQGLRSSAIYQTDCQRPHHRVSNPKDQLSPEKACICSGPRTQKTHSTGRPISQFQRLQKCPKNKTQCQSQFNAWSNYYLLGKLQVAPSSSPLFIGKMFWEDGYPSLTAPWLPPFTTTDRQKSPETMRDHHRPPPAPARRSCRTSEPQPALGNSENPPRRWKS